LDESIALVEFSKRGRKYGVKPIEQARIEVRLNI